MLRADEEIEDAALRELREEAGIEGEILRLVDVDTVESSYYGNLAIRHLRGHGPCAVSPGPGTTRSMRGTFPWLTCLPLAWSSNEKAIKLYLDFHRDTWAMMDSYRGLFPRSRPRTGISECPQGQEAFLSNVLVKMIEKDARRSPGMDSRAGIQGPGAFGHGSFLARDEPGRARGRPARLRDRAGAWSSMAFRQAGRKLGGWTRPCPTCSTPWP